MLQTKLHRPPVSKEHVLRKHLIDYLDRNRYKPFTLVSAPAGYGKSMLVSSWIEACKCPAVWISLSEEADELHKFLEYLCAGMEKNMPGTLSNTSELIHSVELPSVKILSEILINDLDEIDREFVLVLDDYHLLRNQDINELINTILEFPPQHMHLVIITRRDPMLDLTRLNSYGRMNQVRMKELCFSNKEILALYEKLIGLNLDQETAEKLLQKTEGWITGLRLASLSIQKFGINSPILKENTEEIHLIVNYLVEEVTSPKIA